MQIHAGRMLGVILFTLLASAGTGVSADLSVGVASVYGNNDAVPEAHGWVVLPKPGEEGFVLIHLPPRNAARHGGVEGLARLARTRSVEPVALAADGRRVYMVVDDDKTKLLSIDAVPTSIDGIWRDQPVDRMTPHTPLPPGGEVIGLAVNEAMPIALLKTEGRLAILGLDQGSWKEIESLGTATGEHDHWILSSDVAGPVLCRVSGQAVEIQSFGADGLRSERVVSMPEDSTLVGFFRGRLVLLAPDSDEPGRSLLLIEVGSGLSTLASIEMPVPAADSRVGVVVLPELAGRLVLIWAEHAERQGRYLHKIREISLSTGHTLYDGPVERVVPVSAEEFQLLAVGLMLMLIVSLFVVLRPVQGRDAITLPEGWALAAPSRRFAATVCDVLICALPVSRILGVPIHQIITAGALFEPDDSWLAIPAVFAVGLVYSSVTESLFAGTFGKLLTGCRVVRVGSHADEAPTPLGPAACLVRNLIKWVLPPVAGLAFLEPSGRHRGDLIAGAVVVVRTEPPEKGPPEKDP